MYGFDANKLEQFITKPIAQETPWGQLMDVAVTDHYALQRVEVRPGVSFGLQLVRGTSATVFVESGVLQTASTTILSAGTCVALIPGTSYDFSAKDLTVAYLFSSRRQQLSSGSQGESSALTVMEPTDRREKYWGDICTIVSKDVAGKRLFLKADSHGSMEFHVKKYESYYVHSGELALLLRAGRAENRLFRVPAGTAVTLPPGLMHQRGAITDTVLFEIPTADDDADSFLVEDGTKTPMAGFAELFVKREA